MKNRILLTTLLVSITAPSAIHTMDTLTAPAATQKARYELKQFMQETQLKNVSERAIMRELAKQINAQARNNRINISTFESIIDHVFEKHGLIDTTQDDQELARALELSLQLSEQKQHKKKSLHLARALKQQEDDYVLAVRLQQEQYNTSTHTNNNNDDDENLQPALLLSKQQQKLSNTKTTQTTTHQSKTENKESQHKTFECPICLDEKEVRNMQVLKCMHKLCNTCYGECFKKRTVQQTEGIFTFNHQINNQKCPVCRTPF